MPSSTPRWPEIKALFNAIAEQPPGDREALIAAAALDASSQAELRSLLAHHDALDAAPSFLRDAAGQAMGATDIPQDPRFCNDAIVAKNLKALNEENTRRLSTKTAAEWETILNKAGIAAMEVLPLARAVHHPQLEHRNFFHRFDDTGDTGLPPFSVPTAPYRLSASPATIHALPPRLGEHTDAVLAEYGYSADEIARLRADNIV